MGCGGGERVLLRVCDFERERVVEVEYGGDRRIVFFLNVIIGFFLYSFGDRIEVELKEGGRLFGCYLGSRSL